MSRHDISALRPLARLAVGRSGADIERIVREARRKARREVRTLRWDDLNEALGAATKERPEALRWRMAVHEAGHALVHLVVGCGRLAVLSIEASHGGVVQVAHEAHPVETEDYLIADITVRLAGRIAEELVFGDPVAGSGGAADSDLAYATDMATMMEISLGYGSHHPLLYRSMGDRSDLLRLDPKLASAIHARLEACQGRARAILKAEREIHLWLAKTLMREGVIEGEDLAGVVMEARRRLSNAAGVRPDVDDTAGPAK